MTLPKGPTWPWIIGVLLAMVSALSSIAYGSAITRITNLEAAKDLSNTTVAALSTEIAVLKNIASTTKDAVERVESRQEEMIRQQELLLRNGQADAAWRAQVGAQTNANSKRWNEVMDRQPGAKKKKEEPMGDPLEGVHPRLVKAIQDILAQMALAGHPMKVTNGVRTQSQQQAIYAQGRTLPGPVVTHCNGLTTRSNHQPHNDGFGHAVDVTFVNDRGRPVWKDTDPWNLYGTYVRAHGLQWGGDWRHPDRPHAELPDESVSHQTLL